MNKLIVIAVFVFIFFCVLWITSTDSNENIEAYYNYCGSCYGKTIGQCLQCVNCGFISKDGYGKCVEGDMYGPYDFNPEYVNARWIHNDQYWSHILVSDDVAIPTTYVYNYRYPYYRRWIGRRPGKWIKQRSVFNEYPKMLNKTDWNKIAFGKWDMSDKYLTKTEREKITDAKTKVTEKENKRIPINDTRGKTLAYES